MSWRKRRQNKIQWRIQPLEAITDDWLGEWQYHNQCWQDHGLWHQDWLQPALALAQQPVWLARCYQQNQLQCALLLNPLGYGRWQSYQPSQLPLGLHIKHSDSQWQDWLPSLQKALPGFTLSIGLTGIDRRYDQSSYPWLAHIISPYLNLDQDFDHYWQQRGKNLRRNVRRQYQRLQQLGSVMLVIEDQPEAMAAQIAYYSGLEQASWKQQQGTAVNSASQQGQFFADVMTRFAQRQQAQALSLQLDGKIIAMDLSIVHQGVAMVLKTAFDPQWAKYSPATLLRYLYLQQWMADCQLHRLEFYGPKMPWHQALTEQVTAIEHLNHYAHPWLSYWQRLRSGATHQQLIK